MQSIWRAKRQRLATVMNKSKHLLLSLSLVSIFTAMSLSAFAEEQAVKKPAPKTQAIQPKGPAVGSHPPTGTSRPMVGPGQHAIVGSGHPMAGPGGQGVSASRGPHFAHDRSLWGDRERRSWVGGHWRMRLLVDGRRLLVFLRPPDGGAAGRRFRHRVCRSVDRTSRSAAPRRRICTTASGSAASSAAGPRGGRRRSGRRRRGWHSRRRVDRPTWRCGCRRSHRRRNWSSHRRASRAAAWILFVAGRLLLPIPVRPIRRRRPSLLQLSGGLARGSANDLIRKTQADGGPQSRRGQPREASALERQS
jgi:hypothetical protein